MDLARMDELEPVQRVSNIEIVYCSKQNISALHVTVCFPASRGEHRGRMQLARCLSPLKS